MKSLKTILGIALATATFGGAIAAGAVAFNASNDGVRAVEAEGEYSQGSVIAKDKARIWIGYDTGNPFYSYADPNTSDANSSGLNGGIKLWIHSTESGGSEKIYNLSGNFENGAQSNRRYSYCDVDLSVYTNEWYLTVQKFQGGNWKCQTTSIQLKASNAFQVYFIWGNWAWDKTQGTVGAGSIDSVDAGLVAKALGGMHTCSNSNINGYNAFPNFNSTFVKNGDNWKTSGNLGDYSVDDFANGDTSYSGSASTTTNAYTKYEYVETMYKTGGTGSSSRVIGISNKNNAVLIVIASVGGIAMASFATLLFIRKKKEVK